MHGWRCRQRPDACITSSAMSRIVLSRTTQADCDPRAGTVFFVGTATVLFRLGGYTILTDPNFLHQGDHVHLGYGLVAKRLTEPALEIDQLPPLDLVVLSHYHGDHFDRIAEQRLDRAVPIITTRHAAASSARRASRRRTRSAPGNQWRSPSRARCRSRSRPCPASTARAR